MFLLIYIAVYGGMNAYGWYKVCRAFGARPWVWGLFGLAVASLVCLPVLLALWGERTPPAAERLLAWLAFVWMAYAFWFAFVHGAVDTWNTGLRVADGTRTLFHPARATGAGTPMSARRLHIGRRPACVAGFAWLALASVWGFVEAGRVRVRTVELPLARMPASAPPIRLLQITDFHLGRTMRPRVVDRVLGLVAEADADCIVVTGDLIDGHDERVGAVMDRLGAVPARLGTFAVTGNHEVYPGVEQSVAMLERSGFRVLRQEAVPAGDLLWIAGVDDPAVRREQTLPGTPLDELYRTAKGVLRVRVLLKHQPTVNPQIDGAFDLQLSGHIHGGQIFPFGLITWAAYGITTGELHRRGDAMVYVSPGCGTWGPPFRLFARPEITVFVIRPERE